MDISGTNCLPPLVREMNVAQHADRTKVGVQFRGERRRMHSD